MNILVRRSVTQEIAVQLLAAMMLSLIAFCASAQETSKVVSGPLAEFNMAIATVMKIPVTLNLKGKKTEGFCKRPETLDDTELKKLQLSCEKIFFDTNAPEIQRVAAKYILGKTKTQYIASGRATRDCDEALQLLSAVADFYDQRNIIGNGPHEAIASCLVATKKYKNALEWIDRGLKIKETSQIYFLAGVSWKNLQEPERAQIALKKSVTLDPNNAAAKNLLAEIEPLLVRPSQIDTPEPEPILVNESGECQQWKAAISENRAICDALLGKSYDEFFACMDTGMTNSGYGPRSDEQTQMLYQTCGISSWTDESLSP